LNKTELEKDLGIYKSNDLKWKEHVYYAIGKANKNLSMIKKSFQFLEKKSL
ncbi:hypothetical protein HELRODRAFT_145922, partial [Helobdella robusta]|uniref:Uncharacterized protein n=1 Tax=Helobdella robusta TaxID=6412 RepID=T1EJN9_HELRO